MSAIKNSVLKILFSTFLLLTFFSCQKKAAPKIAGKANEITFIGVSNVGGKLGHYKTIKITKDSIKLTQGISSSNIHKKWNSTINEQTWKKLTSSIDIKTLDKIKSSESTQAMDGSDETFQIKTLKNSHIYVNSYNDTIHYQQFQNIKDQLQKILPKEYQ